MGGKAALIHVLGFGFLIGYVSTNLMTIAGRSQGNMAGYFAATESHALAVSGANVALARLYADTSWRGTVTQTLTSPFTGAFTYSVVTLPNGRPFLRCISRVNGPDEYLQDTVEVRFNGSGLQSFSLFFWMTNFEGNVYWITRDSVWGRVHSNGPLHINGSPVFMDKVTTSKLLDPKWGGGINNAIFKDGVETGVAAIEFPRDLSAMFTAAAGGGRAYAGNVEVRMNPGTSANNDGYALVYSGGTRIDSVSFSDPSFSGVIASTGTVGVVGTLDGKLSIASGTNIEVLDDILYENRSMSTSDDVLGLVAEGNVVVKDNAPNRSDCSIDGSIFVRTGSFGAENYTSGSPRGTLKVLGSIVQDMRGAVGTFRGGSNPTLRTGYYKAYTYDSRLADNNFRPPFYPGFYSQTFTIASWWESVHVPKFY